MTRLKLINSKEGQGRLEPLPLFVRQLYEDAFPKEERRPWEALLNLLEIETAFRLYLIKENEVFIGFLSLWQLSDGISFIEHFALLPHTRNRGLGVEVLSCLRELKPSEVFVLECEPPMTELAERRLNFYQRQGFTILTKTYEQPSYYPDAKGSLAEALPLYLLSSSPRTGIALPYLIHRLHRLVYHIATEGC